MARERYLVNSGEDTIHQNIIRPETAKEKRENWWFYHRGHVIGGVILAAVLFSIFYSIFSKVEPDYRVALMTSYSLPTNGEKQLEGYIAEYCDDRNGDGKVSVDVVTYIFSPDLSSPQMIDKRQAEIARLLADSAVGDSVIFLYDEAAFDAIRGNFVSFFQYNDGTVMPELAEDFENARRPWSDFKALSKFTPVDDEESGYTGAVFNQLFERLFISLRTAEDSVYEQKEKYMNYYEDSLKLYERLEKDEPFTGSDSK